jgi:hypothetical protein
MDCRSQVAVVWLALDGKALGQLISEQGERPRVRRAKIIFEHKRVDILALRVVVVPKWFAIYDAIYTPVWFRQGFKPVVELPADDWSSRRLEEVQRPQEFAKRPP